jgi:hypothetical protein
MKIIYLFIFFFSIGNICQSQILKKVLNDAKNNAESRARSKVIQKTNQAIDSILTPGQKTEKKNKEAITTQQTGSSKQGSNTGSSSGAEGGEGLGIGEGFVQLSVSADEVFKGGTVVITGSSIKYGDLKEVKLEVKGEGDEETESLKLFDDGSFAAGWQSKKSGLFTITVISSDGKDKKSKQVKVVDMELIDWCDDNIEETQQALDKLKKEAAKVKQSIGPKDRQKLDTKLKALEQKTTDAMKLFKDLNNAMKQVGSLLKKGAVLPPNLVDNLSELNDHLASQHKEMQRVNDAVDHEPYDNSVCEYIVMVNEALQAFSTFTNFWAKSVSGVLKNIVLDKAVPKQVEMINQNTVKAGPATEFVGKEGSKIFTTALDDAKALESGIGKAGIAGDVAQFATEFLLKTYCGIFKGELSHKYIIIYRNSDNIIWWQYSYTTRSVITFRYPKSQDGSGIIKMKGNIEGNATNFRFTEDMEEEDSFKEKMKTHRTMNHIPGWGPKSVPFSTAQGDVMGFGSIFRGIATPASFNIPVDAEYNTEAETIKLNLNEALIDFTPLVKYTYVFLKVSLNIPLFTRVDFPINKARATLNAVISRNNQLNVTKDAKNNLIVKGSGERHIGSESEPIEHKISYTLTAKNDN